MSKPRLIEGTQLRVHDFDSFKDGQGFSPLVDAESAEEERA
jgi:hypothetical protein